MTTDNDEHLIGYARVSTEDQNPELQIGALVRHGVPVENIFIEKVSGRAERQPQRELAVKMCREGSTFVVWKMDRVSRGAIDLLSFLRDLKEKGIEFRSISEVLNDETAGGNAMIGITAVMAQFESDVTKFRTKAGMDNRREKGLPMGRPTILTDAVCEKIEKLIHEGTPIRQIARNVKFPREEGGKKFKALIAEATIRKLYKGEFLDQIRTKGPRSTWPETED